jgi:class 3 adenylate cyclase
MPLYIDRHDLADATAADVAAAHMRDLEVQDGFGVRFVTYWFEEAAGSEIKHNGDGIMAAFISAFQAVAAAIQVQRTLHERDDGADGHLHVCVGVAAGEPVTEQNDLFGAAVQ